MLGFFYMSDNTCLRLETDRTRVWLLCDSEQSQRARQMINCEDGMTMAFSSLLGLLVLDALAKRQIFACNHFCESICPYFVEYERMERR
jgi:hypothetical protein